ncbi:MAG TPA: hypothetical protein VLA48_02700 [Nitrososphaeraceae archaeon]|nr:hypothetical protein [Nitrososphaeraceae archaeon]
MKLSGIKINNIMKENWEFERSSGYAGYRNKITGEWNYEKDFLNKFTEKENKTEEKLYTKEQLKEAYMVGKHGGKTQLHLDFEDWFKLITK